MQQLNYDVWYNKYRLEGENTPDDMHRRIAREISRVDKQKFGEEGYSEDFIFDLMKDFTYIIPQGSPLYGIGNSSYISLSNCYVLESPVDSYGGIHRTDEQITQISKRRGGVGLDISNLRPVGTPTTNSSKSSTGIVSFMERYSNSIREVGQRGRRGALMITLSVHHPEVLDFAQCKRDLTKVTGANISIRLTDEFLSAVEYDHDYEQRFPVDSKNPKISIKVRARDVWKKIIECAWATAEPGLLFWDRVISESPADFYKEFGFKTVSTNPCGEIPLCEFDSCRLLALNLFGYVENPFKDNSYFNYNKFYNHAQIAQRLMDDIIDIELECIQRIINKIKNDPETKIIKRHELEIWQNIYEKCVNGRRTGVGITALGDTLAALNIKYGSDESIKVTETIYQNLKLGCYRSSVDMAKKLGAFPIWNWELEKDNPFLKRIADEDKKLYNDMKKYGRRNIALLTTAPTGSISLLAGTTSGIEPLFSDVPYIRRKKINHNNNEGRVDFVDQSGDSWQEYEVVHPKLKLWMDITGETDYTKSPYHGCCAEDIDWKQRVKLQAAAQKHIDHSISSTINLPEDITENKVAEIYETAWKAGCKGVTVYRKNCRTGVLIDAKPKTSDCIQHNNAPKRPKHLTADVHFMKTEDINYYVVVGKLGKQDPYEIFIGINGFGNAKSLFQIPTTVKEGEVIKRGRGDYILVCEDKEYVLVDKTIDPQVSALTRLLSTSLRHGANIQYIVEQLGKIHGDMQSFAKCLARTLKKYVPDGKRVAGQACEDCGKDALVYEAGCSICKQCGFSKCN